MHKIFIFISAMILYSCITLSSAPKYKTILTKNNVVAHRGCWKKKNLPENSIASLKQAIKLHCAGSEFDVRMTTDSLLVINHDPNYKNLTIEKTKYSDLIPFRLSNGEKLPTFEEFLIVGTKNNKHTKLVCEIKPSGNDSTRTKAIVQKTLQLVEKYNAQAYMIFISFDYKILKEFIRQKPDVETQYLAGDKLPEELKSVGINGADYYYQQFKKHPEWIENAKKLNITLNAWTVNETIDMQWFIANDFNFITTNEPEILLNIYNAKRALK